MIRALRRVLPLFLLLLVAGCNSSSRVSVGPGRSVPDFEIQDLRTGKLTSFLDEIGSVSVLHLWASWCAPCIEEMPELDALYRNIQGAGGTIVAVGIDDTAEELKRFADRLNVSFPLFIDTKGNLGRRFGITGVPETFIVNSEGKFVLIDDPEDGEPRVRIVGPRSWTAPRVIQQIQSLIPNR